MGGSKKKKGRFIETFMKEVQWEKRVKAVCKPCWEIRYCPYGRLVEDFPLQGDRGEKSCRVFGHDCPVYYVAEPFTETKDMRNISRKIPRTTQFRVLKRENQICSMCGKAVKDEDVEFDHVIPRSKGGSSDEHNVRLLCAECNRRKGKTFEDEYLIKSINEHVLKPINIDTMRVIIEWVKLARRIRKQENRHATPTDFCRNDGRRKVRDFDKAASEIVRDIDAFLCSGKPDQTKQRIYNALKYRWGVSDGEFHKFAEAAAKWRVDVQALLAAEVLLINRLGWQVKITEATKKQWLSL